MARKVFKRSEGTHAGNFRSLKMSILLWTVQPKIADGSKIYIGQEQIPKEMVSNPKLDHHTPHSRFVFLHFQRRVTLSWETLARRGHFEGRRLEMSLAAPR